MSLNVFKFGGGATINLTALAQDAAVLGQKGWKIIIIAGGNAALDLAMQACSKSPRILTSERGEKSRFTDLATLQLLKQVYGKIAREIAKIIRQKGVRATACVGASANLIWGERHRRLRIVEKGKRKMIPGDLTGRISKINLAAIRRKLQLNAVLVLYPPIASQDGEINVDGDKIAAKVASELKAEKLIFFAEAPGILRELTDEKSYIPKIKLELADQYAVGRMKKKILAAKRACQAGVKTVIFADGRLGEQPIQKALQGQGTFVA